MALEETVVLDDELLRDLETIRWRDPGALKNVMRGRPRNCGSRMVRGGC